MTAPHILISDTASARINDLRGEKAAPGLMLRVTVLGGGCSGFQYEIGFEDTVQADDFVFEKDGAKIVADATSMDFLNGAEVYYEQSMLGAKFKIRNPNAASGCGCGKSFSVKM